MHIYLRELTDLGIGTLARYSTYANQSRLIRKEMGLHQLEDGSGDVRYLNPKNARAAQTMCNSTMAAADRGYTT